MRCLLSQDEAQRIGEIMLTGWDGGSIKWDVQSILCASSTVECDVRSIPPLSGKGMSKRKASSKADDVGVLHLVEKAVEFAGEIKKCLS